MKKSFCLFTGVSGKAIGAVLAQGNQKKNNPVANNSRVLRGRELDYTTYERKALTIYEAIKHFRQYLYASSFVVYTDDNSLLTLQYHGWNHPIVKTKKNNKK